MTRPSNAELREAIEKLFEAPVGWNKDGTPISRTLDTDLIIDQILALFQAREQAAFRNGQLDCQMGGRIDNHVAYKQLITELLGAKEVYCKLHESMDTKHIEDVEAVPAEIIDRYREEL